MSVVAPRSDAPPASRRVPTYCYQCVAGPDLLTVKVVDGVATEVEPNFCAASVHPGGGKVCVKAFGLVQKTYNPHRVLSPGCTDAAQKFGSTSVATPSTTLTVSRSGPATH